MILNKELGYYECNGKEFGSKISACVYATLHNKEVKWNFNDYVFKNVDWSIEPSESLTELYNKRAKELREKYDYIVISYSGGADSHNVLMSFIRQGLHVDEILVNTFEKANTTIVNDPTVTDAWNYGAEYALQIYPRLNEIRNQIPQTKINVVDLSNFVLEKFNNLDDVDWVLDQKEVLNPSGVTRYNYLHAKEIRKQFDKGYKVGMIVGIEKPTTYIKNGQFHLAFFDRSANIAPVQMHFDEYDNTTIEFFYWHPTCTKMIAKQAHEIKRWLELHPQHQHIWTLTSLSEFKNKTALIHKLLRGIIYTDTWNHSWFQTDKGAGFWHDDIDQWFFTAYKDTHMMEVWNQSINWVKVNAAKYYTLENGQADSLDTFVKVYMVGPIKQITV